MFKTAPATWSAVQAVSLLGALLGISDLAKADNPFVQTIYTPDPAPIVHDGRVYVFTGHDEDGSTDYNMIDWRLFSSTDMANWQHRQVPLSLEDFAWADRNAWAGQVIARNDKFYFFVPLRDAATSTMSIGVAVSDNIEGPYEDAIGRPLLSNAQIDPTVFIDDDEQAYMYWGNPGLFYVKLNEDMISYDGDIVEVELTTAGFGERDDPASERPTSFEEAPWLYKREGLYYMIYAANCCAEDIRYSTAPSATGPWTYRGIIMPTEGNSFTNHPGIVDYEGTSYFFYHNGALPGGSGYTRSVAVESFTYTTNQSIPEMKMTAQGPDQIRGLDPYVRQEAETMAWAEGVETEPCSEGGVNIAHIENGDYIKVNGVAFGEGASSFTASVASDTTGGDIELRLGSNTGKLIGTCTVVGTGGWQSWETISCPVAEATDTQDLFFVFTGDGDSFLLNFDWWQFESE